jgi:hypothetical protein
MVKKPKHNKVAKEGTCRNQLEERNHVANEESPHVQSRYGKKDHMYKPDIWPDFQWVWGLFNQFQSKSSSKLFGSTWIELDQTVSIFIFGVFLITSNRGFEAKPFSKSE